jgi:hypothetical protein
MSCLEIVRDAPQIKEVILRLTPDQARYIMYCAALVGAVRPGSRAASLYKLFKSTDIANLPVNHSVRF